MTISSKKESEFKINDYVIVKSEYYGNRIVFGTIEEIYFEDSFNWGSGDPGTYTYIITEIDSPRVWYCSSSHLTKVNNINQEILKILYSK